MLTHVVAASGRLLVEEREECGPDANASWTRRGLGRGERRPACLGPWGGLVQLAAAGGAQGQRQEQQEGGGGAGQHACSPWTRAGVC